MDAAAIQEIRDLTLAGQELVEVDGYHYYRTPGGLKPVVPWDHRLEEVEPRPDLPTTLKFSTLASMVGFIEEQTPVTGPPKFVHVESPTSVKVWTRDFVHVGDDDGISDPRRACYAQAVTDTQGFVDTGFAPLEDFLIDLMCNFAPTEARNDLIALLSNVEDMESLQATDSGLSQTVIATKGVATRDREELPNPVALAPFRTFREVEQPESKYIIRLKGLQAGLFLADGGTWKLEAVESIKDHLQELLGENIPVYC